MLEGKRILITGVLTTDSIAWHVANLAQKLGAEIVLTGFGRARRITERAARMLPETADVLELDVREEEQFPALTAELRERWGTLDGVLHAIAYAPQEALGEQWLEAKWPEVAETVRISAYSFCELAHNLAPLLERDEGTSSLVTLAIEPDHVRPLYGWMGPAKEMLIGTSRYLVSSLGSRRIRSNVVMCGPLATTAAQNLSDFDQLTEVWQELSALGWDSGDATVVAGPICFLLSDYARGITGAALHVDGGFPQFDALLDPSRR